MRTFPLHALLSLGALLALGVYAFRLGFLPGAWVGAGLGLYALLVLWGLRFGRHHALLGLGLFAYWFPPLAFLVPLLFALLFGRGLREKEQAALYGWALVWPALALGGHFEQGGSQVGLGQGPEAGRGPFGGEDPLAQPGVNPLGFGPRG